MIDELNDPFEFQFDADPADHKKFEEILRKQSAVFCCSKETNKILMLSHYADKHKGWIIEFEFNEKPSNQNVAAASPKYLDKMGRPKHPKDLLSHNCILPRLGNDVLYDHWEFEQKMKSERKAFQLKVKGSLILNDSLLAIEAATDGNGITYTTEDVIKDKVKSGKLEIILKQFSANSTGFYLYYPNLGQVLPKLRAFIDHLKEFKDRVGN